jgi:molecular chaperone DnaK (HSP70)
VEKMLLSGMENANTDLEYRHLVEARNKAEPILRAVEKQLPDAGRLLPPSDVKLIEEALDRLKVVLGKESPQDIQEATSALNQSTVRLAELIIKETLSKSS